MGKEARKMCQRIALYNPDLTGFWNERVFLSTAHSFSITSLFIGMRVLIPLSARALSVPIFVCIRVCIQMFTNVMNVKKLR